MMTEMVKVDLIIYFGEKGYITKSLLERLFQGGILLI